MSQQKISDRKSKVSAGKIYLAKREPLSQITHYPKSVIIDDFYLSNLASSRALRKKVQVEEKVIKFVGNFYENIRQVINGLDTLKQYQNHILMEQEKNAIQNQFSQILRIFYAKIQKIRKQRDTNKNLYETQKTTSIQKIQKVTQQMNQLEEENLSLIKQKQCLMQKLEISQKKKQFFQREYLILQQKNKYSQDSLNIKYRNNQQDMSLDNNLMSLTLTKNQSFNNCSHHCNANFNRDNHNDTTGNFHNLYQPKFLKFQKQQSSNLLDYSNYFEKQQQISSEETSIWSSQGVVNNRISTQQKDQIQKLLQRHNLTASQLSQIIDEYLKQLHQVHDIEFQNQEEKRLYFLAKKMDTKIWNKKVKKDIEKLMCAKDSTSSSRVEKSFNSTKNKHH